ncbi:hypothetical protein C2G38_2037723 [Gigaspora rosea]|uniref:SAM domain-containing protein n=1 Tax=Gigaspora rosea TaxID=44941 RepID=A0A397V5Z6_9GLOM|nr:hypothetical protein C2G38_2037723 [Gigaspora rosea]
MSSVFVDNWDTEALITFLREQELKGLDEEDFNVLRKANITGQSFLKMGEVEFIKAGVAFGPAIILAKEVESFKTKRSFSPYRTMEDLREVLELYKINGESIVDIQPVIHKLESDNSSLRFCIEDVKQKLENMGSVIASVTLKSITKDHIRVSLQSGVSGINDYGHSNKKNRKKKNDETLDYEYVYGIVSTGVEWIFLLYTTDSIYCTSQKVYRIPLDENSLNDDTELRRNVKEILEIIIGILEDRANVDSSPAKKKQRIEEYFKKEGKTK